MIQFECTRVIYPLVSFTFGSTEGCPFPLHAGKGECYMWPVKEVEIHDAKMVQFECPRVIHPMVSFTFWVICGVSISLYAEKGKCCMRPVNKVEIPRVKIGVMDQIECPIRL